MTVPPAASPESRLATLERRVARQSALIAALTVGLAVAFAWQLAPRPVVDASRFMLRDSTGRFRGGLMLREDGSPVVRLNDIESRPRLYGVVAADGRPRLRLYDSTGVQRLSLDLEEDGRPHVRLLAPDGTSRVHAWVDSAGAGWAEVARPGASRSVSAPGADADAASPKMKRPRHR